MNELQKYEQPQEQQISLFNRGPSQLVAGATEISKVLSQVIRDRKLSVILGGKEHVKAEGWNLLYALLGIAAVERETKELPDGSYESIVDLKRMSDGMIVGSGSALCGVEEKRWGKADKYARRSMAITRATSKAGRNSYSWIMALSGYEVCPAEEIKEEEEDDRYYGTDEQKIRLNNVMLASGITNVELRKAVHQTCMGKSREMVNRILDEAIETQASSAEGIMEENRVDSGV